MDMEPVSKGKSWRTSPRPFFWIRQQALPVLQYELVMSRLNSKPDCSTFGDWSNSRQMPELVSSTAPSPVRRMTRSGTFAMSLLISWMARDTAVFLSALLLLMYSPANGGASMKLAGRT